MPARAGGNRPPPARSSRPPAPTAAAARGAGRPLPAAWKAMNGALPRRPVQPLPRHLPAPARRLRAQRRQRPAGAPGEEAVAGVLDIPLDPRLVFGVRHAGRVDQEAVVPRQFPIRPVDARVVAVGVGDARRQIVQRRRAAGTPPRKANAATCPSSQAGAVLGGRRVEELVAAMAQRQQEGVELAPSPRLRIVPQPHIEEVDLRLLARGRVVAADRHARGALQPVRPVLGHIAIEDAPTRRQPPLLAQPLVQHASGGPAPPTAPGRRGARPPAPRPPPGRAGAPPAPSPPAATCTHSASLRRPRHAAAPALPPPPRICAPSSACTPTAGQSG